MADDEAQKRREDFYLEMLKRFCKGGEGATKICLKYLSSFSYLDQAYWARLDGSALKLTSD